METTKKEPAAAVLYTADLDTVLIQSLSRHWVVIVEKRETDIKLELYNR